MKGNIKAETIQFRLFLCSITNWTATHFQIIPPAATLL